MNPSFCANCGKQMAADIIACSACGFAAGGSTPVAPGPITQPQPAPYQNAAPQPQAPQLNHNQPATPQFQTRQAPSYRQPPGGSNSNLPKIIFFVLAGLVGLVVLAIAGVFVASLLSGVDGALEKIGMECSPATEEDWEYIEDPELIEIGKRNHSCELDDNKYIRISKSDYDTLLDTNLSEIIDSEESVERKLEECEDEDSSASRTNAGNLAVGDYVFVAAGSNQIKQLAEALEVEGVDSEEAETACERLAKTQK